MSSFSRNLEKPMMHLKSKVNDKEKVLHVPILYTQLFCSDGEFGAMMVVDISNDGKYL